MRLRCLAYLTLVLAVVLLGACAPGRQRKDNPSGGESKSPGTALAAFPKVTFSHEASPLGDMLRKLGQQAKGGIVAMAGLEERPVPAVSFEREPYELLANRLAEAVECKSAPLSHAYFIYPERYEALLQVSLEGRLHERFAGMNASVAFGAKTRLANVLAVLSESLDTAIVADNYLADAACGEIFMDQAPLQAVLEALLMSARIPAQEIAIDCTEEYLFIASLRSTAPRTALLTEESSLSAEQAALLNRVVDVVLPEVGANPVQTAFSARPALLKNVLTPLTRQLAVEVAAKRSMAEIPINPCTLHKVRVRTVMDLMIRQWPLEGFGYELNGSQLLIRPR